MRRVRRWKRHGLLGVACAAWLTGSGCATGLPLGAHHATHEGYVPIARANAPRPTPQPIASEPLRAPIAPGAREAVVAQARALVGKAKIVVDGKRFGDDCTGLVRAIYAHVGVDLMDSAATGDNGVTAIWRHAQQYGRTFTGGRPVEGDLVFFRETYDLNRDGQANDGLTHIGVVDTIDEDGTVIVIHRVAHAVVRYRMNLGFPDTALSPSGRPVNDWLRAAGPSAHPQLTSQLFAGYATLLPVEGRIATR